MSLKDQIVVKDVIIILEILLVLLYLAVYDGAQYISDALGGLETDRRAVSHTSSTETEFPVIDADTVTTSTEPCAQTYYLSS